MSHDPASKPNHTGTDVAQLDSLIGKGYDLQRGHQSALACDRWLEAWDLLKTMIASDVTTTGAATKTLPGLTEYVDNWCQDLEMELRNAGLDSDEYHGYRLDYARDFLERFPDEDRLTVLNFRRAEGEALWDLGRRAESEASYAALVDEMPDDAWAYIGWADHYWLLHDSPKEYARAEAILERALARPDLDNRLYVLERLAQLYDEWEKPEERDAVEAEMSTIREAEAQERHLQREEPRPSSSSPRTPISAGTVTRSAPKLGRNEPCWCGSGRKYKHCHLKQDRL
jgi:tetratricopeptide (TPR) repeat protein